jgi:hypothetical protein
VGYCRVDMDSVQAALERLREAAANSPLAHSMTDLLDVVSNHYRSLFFRGLELVVTEHLSVLSDRLLIGFFGIMNKLVRKTGRGIWVVLLLVVALRKPKNITSGQLQLAPRYGTGVPYTGGGGPWVYPGPGQYGASGPAPGGYYGGPYFTAGSGYGNGPWHGPGMAQTGSFSQGAYPPGPRFALTHLPVPAPSNVGSRP